MFYNHEILTSRKYGVATVWLVATLGSKASSRKVNKKTILDVDVTKACNTIKEPAAPMALRLQSSLLFGVSKVYHSQCGYMLVDAQEVVNKLRLTLRSSAAKPDVDVEHGKTVRPEALTLPDDPFFLPELALAGLDYDLLKSIGEASSSPAESVLSPRSLQSSRSSVGEVQAVSVDTSPASVGDIGERQAFRRVSSPSAIAVRKLSPQHPSDFSLDDEDGVGFMPDVDFAFDEEGNLFDISGMNDAIVAGDSQTARDLSSSHLLSVGDEVFNRPVQRNDAREPRATEDQQASPVAMDEANEDVNVAGFDEASQHPGILPRAESAMLRESSSSRPVRAAAVKAKVQVQQMVETSSSAAAPFGRVRPRRMIPLDRDTTLHGNVIRQWGVDYLASMAVTRKKKEGIRSNLSAARRAEARIKATGLGGIGNEVARNLQTFTGDELLQWILSIPDGSNSLKRTSGRKRARSESRKSPSVGTSNRRVRQRSGSALSTTREDDFGFTADAGESMSGSSEVREIDVGRRAPTPVRDRSSSMPWNMLSASVGQRSIGRGLFSVGGAGPGSHSSALRGSRTGRLVSASPLMGRHRVLDTGIGDTVGFPGDVSSMGENFGLLEDFNDSSPAPEARADTQEMHMAAGSPSVATDTGMMAAGDHSEASQSTISGEVDNFFIFVARAIEDKMDEAADTFGGVPGNDAEKVTSISFTELLPPEKNSHVIAAQAFLHALTLCTKGLMAITQEEGFGDFVLIPTVEAV